MAREHAAYKVFSSSRGGPFKACISRFNFRFHFIYRYCFVTRKPFKPQRFCGVALFRGMRFQSLSPTGFFSFFVSGGVMPAACARPKEAKINLMDCICVSSEVEIFRFLMNGHRTRACVHII